MLTGGFTAQCIRRTQQPIRRTWPFNDVPSEATPCGLNRSCIAGGSVCVQRRETGGGVQKSRSTPADVEKSGICFDDRRSCGGTLYGFAACTGA